MWDWLEDNRNYMPVLWTITLVLLGFPVAIWAFWPFLTWIAVLFSLASLLSAWREHLASDEQLLLDMCPHEPSPKGRAAVIVRLRFATFGLLTTIATFAVIFIAVGGELGSPFLLLAAGLVVVGILASLLSTHAAMWTISTWSLMSGIPLNALSIWVALTKQKPENRAAFQRLYEAENKFYVTIAGYVTSFTFRSNSAWLRENLPPIGRLP